MKMMKETNDVKNKEELIKEKEKESEPKDLSSNSKDINDINSGLSNININSEQSKLSKKEIPNVNKDLEIKNKLEIEDNQNVNKNIDTFEKANLDLSPLDEKSIINNNKSNTPIKPQSSPLNFQLKKNANFQNCDSDIDLSFSIITLDIDGNVNLYQYGKESTLFNLYDFKDISQKMKNYQFFSMGYEYYIKSNLNYFCISTDLGCFIIKKNF